VSAKKRVAFTSDEGGVRSRRSIPESTSVHGVVIVDSAEKNEMFSPVLPCFHICSSFIPILNSEFENNHGTELVCAILLC
jgi:hypothetical protein